MSNGKSLIPQTLIATLAQVNPLLGMAVQSIITFKTLMAAVKAQNPTVVFDKTTGLAYADEEAAKAAGVAPENIASKLPSDAVLIENLITKGALLQRDARSAREWLRTIDPSLPPVNE